MPSDPDRAIPPGRQAELDLQDQIDKIVITLRKLPPDINHETLRPIVDQLAAYGEAFDQRHSPDTDTDLIRDLQGIIAIAGEWAVEAQRYPIATDAIIIANGAIDLAGKAAAEALRLAPGAGYSVPSAPDPDITVDAAPHRDTLARLTREVAAIRQGLDALEAEISRPTTFRQQPALLGSYVRAMRVPAAEVEVHLSLAQVRANVSALSRAVGAMARLTESFVRNAVAWKDRLTAAVTQGAMGMLRAVGLASASVEAMVPRASASSTGPTIIIPEDKPAEPPRVLKEGPDFPEMVLIPPGRFLMGIPLVESEREGTVDLDNRSRPQHEVRIAEPFWLARYPVTRGEYAVFVRETGYDAGESWKYPGFGQTDRDPVVVVSHTDSMAYITWLNKRTRGGYRLPSEAEWEYAARAGTTTARFWGDAFEDGSRFAHNDGRGTSPVDQRLPNLFGLHDMLGNVWEWCADEWHDDYSGALTNGARRFTRSYPGVHRVLRGGSWNGSPPLLRAGVRGDVDGGFRNGLAGFRPARTFFTS